MKIVGIGIKLKEDIFKLLEFKNKNLDKSVLYSEKEKMLNANYNLL